MFSVFFYVNNIPLFLFTVQIKHAAAVVVALAVSFTLPGLVQ